MSGEDVSVIASLRERLVYNEENGLLSWNERDRSAFNSDKEYRRWNGRYANRYAGHRRGTGYLALQFVGKMFSAHRVVWAMRHGTWPKGDIDHINGNREDNRLSNLRDVSRSENSRNTKRRCTNKSGTTGVIAYGDRWRAYATIHLGIFDTIEEAAAARKRAEQALGYHANHGRDQ